MKYITVLFLLFVSSSAYGAPNWLRRATLAAGCAASAADAWTTYRAGQRGYLEANPLFRGSRGEPAMGRIVGFKVGLCAFGAWYQERRPEHNQRYVLTNLGVTAVMGVAAFHNANSK